MGKYEAPSNQCGSPPSPLTRQCPASSWMPYTLVSHVRSTALAPHLPQPRIFLLCNNSPCFHTYISLGLHLILEYCSHQTDIIQVICHPQGLSLQIPISPGHILYPVLCVTQAPFNSKVTLTPRESMSRGAAAERNKQQAATLGIASKHLGGIASKHLGGIAEKGYGHVQ